MCSCGVSSELAGPSGRPDQPVQSLEPEKPAKRLNNAGKHRKWGTGERQQVRWTDESRFEVSGCSRSQFVHRRAGGQFSNESAGNVPGKFGLYFSK